MATLDTALQKLTAWLKTLNSRSYIYAIKTVQVSVGTAVASGSYTDVTTTFTPQNDIVPVAVLQASGWWSGGIEIRSLTSSSITVRFLNGTSKTQLNSGYASYRLFFITTD